MSPNQPKWKSNPSRTCRDITLLTPKVQKLLKLFLERVKAIGMKVKIIETYRTKERQALLRKLKKSWIKVSTHQSGRAFDVCIIKNGKFAWDAPHKEWEKLGKIWLELDNKTEWGGEWLKILDLCHFQLNR